MGLTFRRFVADDADALVGFLTGEPWPFHVTAVVSEEQARRRIGDGDFDGEAAQSFWIVEGDETVGLVTLDDLGGGTADRGQHPQGQHRYAPHVPELRIRQGVALPGRLAER